jgi:hypothetical protein
MSDYGPPLLHKLFGVAVGVFVAALLVYTAVRLLEAVLPALLLILLAGAAIGGVVMWWRSRLGGW